jgi:glutathione S-transferase
MHLFWGFYRTPAADRNPRAIEAARARCAERYRRLDDQLASRAFLAGDAFTMGDIPAGTSLFRYFEMGLETPELPNLRRWYGRLAERPAYREHVMRPFEELRGRLAF